MKATYAEGESILQRDLFDRERKICEIARSNQAVFNHFVLGIENQPFHTLMNDLADKHRRVTYDCAVDHGKTVQFSIARILREIGLNPYHTIAIVSSTPKLPKRSLGVIRQNIEENERYHMVFPKVRLVENTKETITVERKPGVVKDPTVGAMGIEGNILGSRWSLLVTDDILRFQTVWTEHERQKAWRRFTGECQGRMEADSWHYDIGTPWAVTDARHKMRRLAGYLFLRFDGWTGNVHDINNKIVYRFPGGLWPEYSIDRISGKRSGWPRERLEKLKNGGMPGHEFQRQIQCIALSQAMEIFGKHLERCASIGEGIEMETDQDGDVKIASRPADPHMRYIFTGVDLAITKQDTSADTAFFTGAIDEGVKHPLELRRGKIEGPEILRQMIQIVRKYPLHVRWIVESNAGQAYLQQFADQDGLLELLGASSEEAARIRGCIEPHYTGKNKTDNSLGIRAMTADFERARWVIPQKEGEQVELVSQWVESLRNFDPTAHPDDMLIASWLFWEACRDFTGNTSWEKFGVWVSR
jgi:hypothetical protein